MFSLAGENIYLKKTSYSTWSKTRKIRFSEKSFKYDPYTPYKTEREEREFHKNYVKAGLCLNFAIYSKNNQLIRFIQAFDFMKINSMKKEPFRYYEKGSECETGIWILDETNHGKGYGLEAYILFLNYLKKEFNLKKTIIYTYSENKNSIGLFLKLGYEFDNTDIYIFNGFEYKKMILLV